jgi:hypothetical protein
MDMDVNQGVRLSIRSHRLKFDFSASGKTLKCAANEEKLSQKGKCDFFHLNTCTVHLFLL